MGAGIDAVGGIEGPCTRHSVAACTALTGVSVPMLVSVFVPDLDLSPRASGSCFGHPHL